jgi:hypothetical protein
MCEVLGVARRTLATLMRASDALDLRIVDRRLCLLKTPKAAKSLEFLCRRPWSGRAENELELESQKGNPWSMP